MTDPASREPAPTSEFVQKPRSRWQAAWWRFKVALGLGSVEDGSICWVSWALWPRRFDPRSRPYREPHDYHHHKGGDGHPAHFHVYRCWRCGREFSI